MSAPLLPPRAPGELRAARGRPVDRDALAEAARIVEEVRAGGEAALRAHAERLGDLDPGERLWLDRGDLESALGRVTSAERGLLTRTAERIRVFAEAQRACFVPLELERDGLRAGHSLGPVRRAGCYAPGGRYPLPSSVLMTVVPARVAGVAEVLVASPRPAPITLAAAAVAGADAVLAVGGAQAIAALTFGVGAPPVDLVCGPGNRWVTAAKKHVFGEVGVDMLAGPSELVVIADERADPALVAADLLAQAEHDPDAVPVLIALSPAVVERVEVELARQLESLPTAAVARAALAGGAATVAPSLEEAAAIADTLAPEHLQLAVADPEALVPRLTNYGALFHGAGAEVLGDYGAGPNHVLPTGRAARFSAGLSVATFLRVRTWLAGAPVDAARDAAALARLEGLEGHARAAARRAP